MPARHGFAGRGIDFDELPPVGDAHLGSDEGRQCLANGKSAVHTIELAEGGDRNVGYGEPLSVLLHEYEGELAKVIGVAVPAVRFVALNDYFEVVDLPEGDKFAGANPHAQEALLPGDRALACIGNDVCADKGTDESDDRDRKDEEQGKQGGNQSPKRPRKASDDEVVRAHSRSEDTSERKPHGAARGLHLDAFGGDERHRTVE